MGEVLSIIAIALLLALVAISVRKQRVGVTQEKAHEAVRTAGAGVQRERSMRRRAEARSAARHDG
jgi:hypothetical protein